MDENRERENAPARTDINFSTLLMDLVRPIVDSPDEVMVMEEEGDDGLLLTLKVADADVGMIIGKHGKIARAIRTVIRAAARISNKKVSVEIK